MTVSSRKGRPRLSGRACYIRERSSVFELWHERKSTLGFAEVTNSVFAEYLLHQIDHRASRLAFLEFDELFMFLIALYSEVYY